MSNSAHARGDDNMVRKTVKRSTAKALYECMSSSSLRVDETGFANF